MQSGKDIMFLKPQTPKPHLRLASEIDCIYLSENLIHTGAGILIL